MKIRKKVKNKGIGFLAAVLFVFAGVWTTAFPVQAASGNVYTCTVHPCFAHPVTGEKEDSGGEASYATGQGMVDGVVYTTGILELTDSGEYYLTVRFSLMDQTSGHSFWVQNVGDTGSWSNRKRNGRQWYNGRHLHTGAGRELCSPLFYVRGAYGTRCSLLPVSE